MQAEPVAAWRIRNMSVSSRSATARPAPAAACPVRTG